jgi:uncharacterized protein YecE (DUF72 family)
MTVWIGTSGWQYRDWRGTFYPEKEPVRTWLESFAGRFATVESNNAFYRLPEHLTFDAWAARTPADFDMAVKMSRYLTHILRLRTPEEPVARFVERVQGLGDKRGPILLQLPPTLQADLPTLAAVLDRLPPAFRVAIEFRHRSWFTDEVRRCLTDRGVALCLTDRRGPTSPVWRTADWTFLRFHEGRATPRPCYGRQALRTWADRLASMWGPDVDAWVYFNNDPRACAPRDAAVFARACVRAGLTVTRTPRPASIRPRR